MLSLSVVALLGIGLESNAIAQSVPGSLSNEPLPAPVLQRSPARPTLRLGSEGAAVRELQAVLLLMGYYDNDVTGEYQEATAIAVATFQQSAGLPVDGVMGPDTWNALLPAAGQASFETSATSPTDMSAMPGESSFPTPSSLSNPPGAIAADASTESSLTQPSVPPPQPSAAPPVDHDETRAAALPTLRSGMRGSAVERLQERLQVLGFYTGAIDGIFGAATESAVQALQRANALNPDGIVGAATWTVLFQ